MSMKRMSKRIISSALTGAMLMSLMGTSGLAAEPGGGEPNYPTMDYVESIQAYTDDTFYGQGLTKVVITYKGSLDTYTISPDAYVLEDRGTLSPDFGEIKIASADVAGQTVTLTIEDNTDATDSNKLIYTGDEAEGSRQRNAFGVYCTGAWYRDTKGNIYYGEGNEEKNYLKNETGMGYQSRESLELKLRHKGEAEDAAACLADDKGQYIEGGLWKSTVDDLNGFEDLYGLNIESTAKTEVVTDGTGDNYVRGYYYIPENYDPANGIVFTLQGQGISYWQLPDGTNDAGTGFLYDSATSSWANKGAIVVNIHDRSSAAKNAAGGYWDSYDFVKDDVNVMKYFIDKYKITGPIVLQGNSRGTMASAMVIKALAGQEYHPHNQDRGTTADETYKLDKSVYDFTIDAYICQNGTFGYQYDDDDWAAVADTGLKVWAFDGEQDSNNIDSIATYTQIMTERKGADWAAENVRLTGYPSEIYSYWGESDHSTTRINGWYFADEAFYGPDCYVDVNGKIVYTKQLGDGDTYTLKGRGNGASKAEYKYTIYDESFQTWALSTGYEKKTPSDFDSIENLAYDYSQAAQLPLTGYYTKNIDVNGDGNLLNDNRTVKVYIAPEASIRSYFTIVAVPDGVETYKFLDENGWIDLADQKGEGLFVLEPGADGWGTAQEESGYYATSDAIPESAADVKEQLFSEAYSTGGYGADFSDGITFTVVDINGELHWVDIQTVENQMEEDLPSAPMPDSLDTYFRMETAMSPDEGTEILRYVMPYDADSYYYNGYQTVLLLNKDSSNNVYAVGSDTITPVFYTGNQVEMFAGHSGSSGVKQNSGETAVEFVSGEVILYSAAAENGTDLKNYWVTFLTQQSGPKLFVNATNDESHYVTVDGESIPQREVFLTDEYNNHHDVFFANIGDQDITGLYVRLENAQNVALDPYWTIGETTTLSAFTTTEPANPYGELANVAKIRLVPATDESGNILAGAVSGTLVIGYTGGGTEPVEEVRISLTGVAGAPKITTESVVDGVQYVPYSSLIQTNNMYESDAVTFELSGGELPEGVIVKPNGEVYGVPKENGSFTFEVTAVYNNDPTLSDTKEFTLEILDNSNQNVRNATDVGYDFVEDFPYEMEVYTDQIFYSQGPLDQFVDFWLDGEKLERDTDYTAEDGSTKITIQAQTFRNAGSGTHTLAAEFRTGGASDLNSTLKRTATNYTSTVAPSASGGGDDGSSSTYPISVTQPNNGTISVSRKNASQGERVTVTARPDTGYQLEKLVVTNSSTGASIAVTEQNGEYSFVMPSNRVIVQASFTPLEPQDDRMPFVDVRRSDWFSDAVAFVYENGLMVGTSETVFEPYTTTSRGMIVTILYQLAGKPESDGSYFADVPLNQYYAKAASWAAEQGVVAGYGDGKFGPDDPITREQIVMILMRYVQYCQIDTAVRGDLTQFADSGSIDPSALEAMAWAYAEDLMVGKGGGILDPKGPATRAEVATILTRLYEIISETNAT